MYLLLEILKDYHDRNNDSIFAPLPKPSPPNPYLLKEAIEDAQVVRMTQLINAKIKLEEI